MYSLLLDTITVTERNEAVLNWNLPDNPQLHLPAPLRARWGWSAPPQRKGKSEIWVLDLMWDNCFVSFNNSPAAAAFLPDHYLDHNKENQAVFPALLLLNHARHFHAHREKPLHTSTTWTNDSPHMQVCFRFRNVSVEELLSLTAEPGFSGVAAGRGVKTWPP